MFRCADSELIGTLASHACYFGDIIELLTTRHPHSPTHSCQNSNTAVNHPPSAGPTQAPVCTEDARPADDRGSVAASNVCVLVVTQQHQKVAILFIQGSGGQVVEWLEVLTPTARDVLCVGCGFQPHHCMFERLSHLPWLFVLYIVIDL